MHSFRSHAVGLLILFTPLIYSCAMATEKVLLWPEIQGQVLNDGKPVSGLDLTQTLYWNYEESTAAPRVLTVKTDAEGRFLFPKITGEIKKSFLTRLFHQPGIGLGIDTNFKGQKIGVFASMRNSYGASTTKVLICDVGDLREFDGSLLAQCDLTEKK